MKEFSTSQEKSDAGYGGCGCHWNFDDDNYIGGCLIDRNFDGDLGILLKKERKIMSSYTDFEDSFDDDYIREINEAYWAEEEEFKLGVHPTQVLERIQERLHFDEIDFCEITFLDWNFEGSRVGVSLDGNFYGVFDYERNIFESTPDTRLNDTLELNQLGLNER